MVRTAAVVEEQQGLQDHEQTPILDPSPVSSPTRPALTDLSKFFAEVDDECLVCSVLEAPHETDRQVAVVA